VTESRDGEEERITGRPEEERLGAFRVAAGADELRRGRYVILPIAEPRLAETSDRGGGKPRREGDQKEEGEDPSFDAAGSGGAVSDRRPRAER
jgi:hypothetical protein